MTAQPIAVLSYVKTCYISSFKSVMSAGIGNEMWSDPGKELWAFMCPFYPEDAILKFCLDTYN